MVAEALKNIPFRWLLASNTAFFLVLHGQMLTRSVLAWKLTGDEMAIAWINLAFAIPMIAIAFPGGVLGDRLNRISLIKICQVLLFFNETIIFALLLMNSLELWHLILSCLFAGLLFPVALPTRTAIVFNLVGNETLGSATALSMTILNISRVIGPALMGWLIAAHGMTATYGIASVLFFMAWAFLLPINKTNAPVHARSHDSSVLRDISEGIRYVMDNRPILLTLIYGMIPMSLSIPMHSILVLFTETIWNVGARGLGLAMSIAGLGGTIGAIYITRRGENTRRTKLMVTGAISFTMLVACFSLTQSFYFALVILFFANIGMAASSTLNHTITQLLTKDAQRGRVSSMMMVSTGFAPMAVAPIAWFAKRYGIDNTMFVCCLILTSILILLYISSSVFRNLDDYVRKSFASDNKQPVDEIETPSAV